MPPEIIAQLVVMYGLPFTQYLITLWQNRAVVDAAEWQKLTGLVQTPEMALAKVAQILGLPQDDPKVVAVAQLIK